MKVPEWADPNLSNDLPQLRARGEDQELEFKREFPEQVTKLAKEIAAFATSNSGVILIGVEDNGDLVGLGACEDAQERDKLVRRLEGICSGSLAPAVTPRAAWAVESDCVVLVVTVPKGSEPIYYSQGKPYLRHITTSRPAEPHEVIDFVKKHLESRLLTGGDEADEGNAFYSELAAILHRVLLWVVTPAADRKVNPWLEEWRAEYEDAAAGLRKLAAQDFAVDQAVDKRFREAADALTSVVTFRLYVGCGHELDELTSHAGALAFGLKKDFVDSKPLGEDSLATVVTFVRKESRGLSDLSRRANQLVSSGGIENLQSDVGALGSQLIKLSFYDLDALGADASKRLLDVGLNLRRIEVARIHMDGGASVKRIVSAVEECASHLDKLAGLLDSGLESL